MLLLMYGGEVVSVLAEEVGGGADGAYAACGGWKGRASFGVLLLMMGGKSGRMFLWWWSER